VRLTGALVGRPTDLPGSGVAVADGVTPPVVELREVSRVFPSDPPVHALRPSNLLASIFHRCGVRRRDGAGAVVGV